MNKKTKYYRHSDPRRGFKLCEQLQIASAQRIMFSKQIQKINNMYRECGHQHTMSFLAQPNQNEILKKTAILLVLPVLVCFLIENFKIITYLYAASLLGIIYYVLEYIKNINECRHRFQQANQILRVQFCAMQQQFHERWPNYSLALIRKWNQVNEICTQYIQIYRKQQLQDNKQNLSSIDPYYCLGESLDLEKMSNFNLKVHE